MEIPVKTRSRIRNLSKAFRNPTNLVSNLALQFRPTTLHVEQFEIAEE